MTRLLDLASALHRRAIALHPDSVRRDFEKEMTDLFAELAADAHRRRGAPGLLALTVRACADTVRSAIAGHREAPDGRLRGADGRKVPERWIAVAGREMLEASRTLRRAPAFTSIAVLTLGLAIGVCTAAYGVVHAYLVRPLPFPEPERLVAVSPFPHRDAFRQGIRPPPGLERLDLRAIDGTFESTAAWDLDGFTLVSGDRPEYVDGAWVSSGFFRTLGTTTMLGRLFDDDETARGAPVAVISHALWQRRFASDPAIIGRSITAYSTDRPEEAHVFTVIGVLPPELWHFNRFTDLLLPLTGARTISMARLAPGVTPHEAERRLDALARAQFPEADPRWSMSVTGARDDHVRTVRPTLVVLLVAVAFVMLVACANVASLLIARSVDRRHEMALRSALGASRGRLVARSVAESVWLLVLATALGVALAALALRPLAPVLVELLRTPVPGGDGMMRVDGGILLVTAGLAVATLAAFGVAPAAFQGLAAPRATLATMGRTTASAPARARLRGGLVAAQLAISLALLSGAGMLVRTTLALASVELGFDPRHVVKASVLLPRAQYGDAHQRATFVAATLERLSRTPEVVSASVVNSHPFRGIGVQRVSAEGVADTTLEAAHLVIGPGYLSTLRVPVLEGRAFDDGDDAAAPAVAIVSRSLAARAWPGGSAIGRRVKLGSAAAEQPWRTIVGIVGDTRKTLIDEPSADVYVPYAQEPRPYFYLVARSTSSPETALAHLRDAVRAVDPRQPVADAGSLPEVLARAGASYRFLGVLLGALSGFTVILATVGLYSVLSYVVSARRREMAVRIALGARRGDVVGLVARQAVPILAMGLLTGVWLSVLVGRTIGARLEGVAPAGSPLLAASSALLLIVALAAALGPARRAARVPPRDVLRE